MKPTLIFISHLGLQHIQKQKNSKRVGYKILKFCLYYNRMTHKLFSKRFQKRSLLMLCACILVT